MNRILLFGDLHVYKHKKSFERLKDCLNALEWVFQTAKKHNIKDIIFAGDLFHDRQKIDVITYGLVFDVLLKYCDGSVNLWLLLGNHDLWFHDKWDISSITPFSALPNVTVINKPCSLPIANHHIDFMPFTHDPINYLKEIAKNEILVGHLAIHGAELNGCTLSEVVLEHDGDMVKVGPELFKHWKQVFLGHYHGHQIINNIEYIGSPLELNFGEAFQEKHLIIYDLDLNKKEYVINDFSPKHIITTQENINKCIIENNFIQLRVEELGSVEVMGLRKEIQDKKPSTLEIIHKPKKEQKQVIQDAKAILHKEDEMLETYVKEVETGSLDKPKLIGIGKKICEILNLNI